MYQKRKKNPRIHKKRNKIDKNDISNNRWPGKSVQAEQRSTNVASVSVFFVLCLFLHNRSQCIKWKLFGQKSHFGWNFSSLALGLLSQSDRCRTARRKNMGSILFFVACRIGHLILDRTSHIGSDISYWIGHLILDRTSHIGSDISYWIRHLILDPTSHIGSDISYWIRHLRLDPTSHIGSDISYWIRHLILDPTSHIGSDISYWIRHLILDPTSHIGSDISYRIRHLRLDPTHDMTFY
jgi:hypothetical protein